MDFNPNADTILGPEILPRPGPKGNLYHSLRSPADVLMETFESTGAETVTNIGKSFRTAFPSVGGGATLVEVVNAGDEVAANLGTATFQPDGGESLNIQRTSDGTIDTNAWMGVVTGADSIVNTPDAIGTIGLKFNTSGALTGKRILDARFAITVGTLSFPGSGPATLRVEIGAMGGSVRGILGSDFYPSSGPVPDVLIADMGEVYPIDETPFTIVDLRNFDSSFPHLVLTLNAGNETAFVFISKVELIVDYCDENRLSRDIVSTGTTGNVMLAAWTPHKADGSPNLAKPATPFTMISRQPRYGTVPQSWTVQADVLLIPCLLDLPPSMPDVILDATLAPNGAVTSLGPTGPNRRIFTETDLALGGSYSQDGQPYGYSSVHPWTVAQQEFTPGSTTTYEGVRLLGTYVPLRDGTIDDLVVTLRLRSDSSVLRTAALTQELADSFPPDPAYEGFRIMHVEWAPIVLTGGVRYYVDLSFSGAAPSSWTMPALLAGQGTAGPNTWHGSTDAATRDGRFTYLDFPWLLVPATPVPTAVTPSPGIYDTGDVDDAAGNCEYPIPELLAIGPTHGDLLRTGSGDLDFLLLATATGYVPNAPDGCLVAGLAYMAVEWTPSSLGALFGYYELQRMDADSGWETIDYGATEAAPSYDDIEVRRGIGSCYRVRVVTAYGITSPWSDAACAVALTGGNGLTFTTNFFPGLGVAATDVVDAGAAAERPYTSPEASEQIVQHLAGRDYAVVLQPAERRGEAFSRSVLVNALRMPTVPGVHAFDALRYIAKQTSIPYVCVRDENGDRWFASISVPDFKIRQPREFYFATVTVLEVQGVPTPTGTAF